MERQDVRDRDPGREEASASVVRPAICGGVVRPAICGGVVRPAICGGVVRPAICGRVVRPAICGGATARQRRGSPRRRARAAVVVAVLMLSAWLGWVAGQSPDQQMAATFLPAASFLHTYVEPDGRVNRPDQGNDTVSEGQAYGLLLAETMGQDSQFHQIWQWTRVHLQLSDGLFAWHANAAGRILSPAPASDADLLIAWALLRYEGPGSAVFHSDGLRVANAVLAYEVTTGAGGMPILTAGPWATGRPATLDPSYWSLPALTGLAQLTGNREWQRLADSALVLTRQLTNGGRLLPPNWAELTTTTHRALRVLPEVAPNANGTEPEAQYGLDSQRTVAWFAASCNPQARALAARWWKLLRPSVRDGALALRLNGTVVTPTPGVLPLVAAASAAHAAGAKAASLRLLGQAVVVQRLYPGYYGGAWAAFGPVLIRTNVLGGC
jgi:endo-1,4-beta-D-glucanase Y